MALWDKVKETANAAKDKAKAFADEKNIGEKFNNVVDSTKKAWDESTAAIKANNQENKELKQPLEGAIIRYEVIYIGGLPEYPKAKHGNAVGMNIMPDRFEFTKTGTSKEWFAGYTIKYESISDLVIDKRTISTAEMLLGGGNDPNQQQENNICITFTTDEGQELMLRVEMLTGGTIYNQAAKCREFIEVLRQNNILKIIKSNGEQPAQPPQVDVLAQIEKLAKLKESGIISEEEFNSKKEELLSKI